MSWRTTERQWTAWIAKNQANSPNIYSIYINDNSPVTYLDRIQANINYHLTRYFQANNPTTTNQATTIITHFYSTSNHTEVPSQSYADNVTQII